MAELHMFVMACIGATPIGCNNNNNNNNYCHCDVYNIVKRVCRGGK